MDLVRLLSGSSVWRTAAEPLLGLPELVMSDGPVGVRGPGWDERRTSLVLPSPTALAATWDPGLVRDLGALLGAEARRKGVDVLLAPNLNLHRSALGGRHFECFSEDPLLTALIGASYIAGVQSRGVAATAKHYVGNEAETERMSYDSVIGPRVLREVYLAPFEAAVAAGVWVVMSAYNQVNGALMAENALLRDPLKTEWGFDGVVVSDWGGVRSTEASARSGQDLAMPGPNDFWGDPLREALRNGTVPEAAVHDKIARLRLLAERVHRADTQARTGSRAARSTRNDATFEPSPGSAAQTEGGAPWDAPAPLPLSQANGTSMPLAERVQRARGGFSPEVTGPEIPNPPAGDPAELALLRRAVADSCVLLKNDDGLLPLATPRVAVIGAHAARTRIQGGGSGGVYPSGVVSILDGLRKVVPDLVYAPGVDIQAGPTPVGDVWVRMLGDDGEELSVEDRRTGWLPEPSVVEGTRTVEVSSFLRPEISGHWRLSVAGWGRLTLSVDGRRVLDADVPCDSDDPATVHLKPPFRHASVWLEEGVEVLVTGTRAIEPHTGRACVLAADPPAVDDDDAIREAVDAARDADVAIVVVGTTEEIESEACDRTSLALSGRQDDLVKAVAAVRRTVVVVNSGGPVAMPWRDEAAALLLCWFPGQQGGHGVADVLTGRREPGGRLPTTWSDVPLVPAAPVDGRVVYAEGLDVGHRGWLTADRSPSYWFGHGLGYTTWSYEDLAADGDHVRVRVRNTGERPGREVVQVYLSKPGSGIGRPARWLAGFGVARAEPGEAVEVAVALPPRAFQHWEGDGWRTEEGEFVVHAGRSVVDLRLKCVASPPS
ncbi:glycoside hydrolase family 3 C-terminal domain-containing protein [Herbidospora cretacea]|uniref:glycoside hydrolase family 3 C-terminal domain-containing protein n=1 Tax=Herbidospora cretacea TaxID=28444 RepID=UPI0007737B7C|nr:glycoside hydrolase family 3 C-terminal domain-containing protein [Herbidospora cretacea]